MNNKSQKLLALLLACLFLVLTACNNKKDDTKKPQNDTSSVGGSSQDDTSSDDISSDDTISDDVSIDDTLIMDDSLLPLMPDTDSSNNDTSFEEGDSVIDVQKVDKDDYPYVKYPAYLMDPMKSYFDKEAGELRDAVLGFEDKIPDTVTGTIWYVSNDGNDANKGTSPDQALQSFNGLELNKEEIKYGDAVLFERGDIFRGKFTAKEGVYYGAYGKGDKPAIYGSKQNYAKANWIKKTDNLWALEVPLGEDAGIVVFNHGEAVGYKKDNRFDLKNNGDFWCDTNNNDKFYIYMDQNPAKKYKSIEIGLKNDLIYVYKTSDVTIENLCLKYNGGHAIYAGGAMQNNITIRGCEIGFVGGSYLSGTLRYGNGIELYKGGSNILCEYNWIYQIYDTGITNQGGGAIYENLTFTKNLIEYCGMGSYEYWLSGEWNVNHCKNLYFTNNICRFAGYCWGGYQRPDKVSTHILSQLSCRNTMFNYHVENNIFDQSSTNLLEIGGTCISAYYRYESENNPEMKMPSNPEPIISGNIYAQNADGLFGVYFDNQGITFGDEKDTVIKEHMKDKEAKIYVY